MLTKDRFIANISHELRTPLNGVIGFSQLLADERTGPLNPTQREYLGDVLHCAQHLLHLINDILDATRIDAGRMVLSTEVFPIAQVIGEVCSSLATLAQVKGVAIRTHLAGGPHTARLDRQRFGQILYNLLSNGIKFTGGGGEVQLSLSSLDSESFAVRVSDTGIGIAPEDMQRLFRDFEQLDDGASRLYHGTGLGLSLTRRLVELQGGHIAAHSTLGQGTTITVVLPLSMETT